MLTPDGTQNQMSNINTRWQQWDFFKKFFKKFNLKVSFNRIYQHLSRCNTMLVGILVIGKSRKSQGNFDESGKSPGKLTKIVIFQLFSQSFSLIL